MKKMYNVVLLVGEAGCGKDTICKDLCNNRPKMFHRVISSTTCPMREGEQHARDYYFIYPEDWERSNKSSMIEETEFNGWKYGTSLDALQENKVNIAVVNPEGMKAFLNKDYIKVLKIYRLAVSDSERLRRQLTREDNPKAAEICRRFFTDKEDFKNLNEQMSRDYPFIYEYCSNENSEQKAILERDISNFIDEMLSNGKLQLGKIN